MILDFIPAPVDDDDGGGGPGTPGVDGKTIRNGSGAPSGGLGVNGDFYIDTDARAIYGPKTAGAWGDPTPLIGPSADDRAVLDVPSDGDGDTTGTEHEIDPRLIKLVRVFPNAAQRARLKFLDPALWADYETVIEPMTAVTFGSSAYNVRQFPATIDMTGIAAYVIGQGSFNFGSGSNWNLTVSVNGTPVSHTFSTDYALDGGGFAGFLAEFDAAFASIGSIVVTVGGMFGTILTFTSVDVGDGTTAAVDADDLSILDGVVPVDGSEYRVGYNATNASLTAEVRGEGCGGGNTHCWPDGPNPNKRLTLSSNGVDMIGSEAYPRDYMRNVTPLPVGGLLDILNPADPPNSQRAHSMANRLSALAVEYAFAVTDEAEFLDGSNTTDLIAFIGTLTDSSAYVPIYALYADGTAARWRVNAASAGYDGPYDVLTVENIGRQASASALYDNNYAAPNLTENRWVRVVWRDPADDQIKLGPEAQPYDNGSSGLSATNMQAAIDELDGRTDVVEQLFTGNGTPDAPTTIALCDTDTAAGTITLDMTGVTQAKRTLVIDNTGATDDVILNGITVSGTADPHVPPHESRTVYVPTVGGPVFH